MSDKIFFLNTETEKVSRYDLSKFMRYTDNFDPLTSKFFEDIKKLPIGGQYRVSGNEFRPDRLSMEIYNSFQYWWIIMLFNDLLEVQSVQAGTIIYYPEQEELEDLYFNLKSQEISQ